MQEYLNQLIADMRHAAQNLPPKPEYYIPPEAEGIEHIIEWENSVDKPMHEWTGITKDVFPPPEKLSEQELVMMVDEILKLWKAYNFIADLPENLPVEIAYKALVDYFDKPVAWISEGNLHIEFCEYEPENCPWPEEFCWCKVLHDELNTQDLADSIKSASEEIIPKKYRELIKNIAASNDGGLVCFINPDTGEMEDALPEWLEDPGELEDAVNQDWDEMYSFEKWERLIRIEPPDSHESFRIMEDFTEYEVSGHFQNQLINALGRNKPFRNFEDLVTQSKYKQDWFDYKQQRLEERAWTLLSNGLPGQS